MKIPDIISVIERIAPLPIAASWDNSGMQLASFRQDVSHMAVMLDPTLEGIERAIGAGADFIVTHHPLSMSPRYPDKADTYLSILSLLLKNEVPLYSAHTSLDANPDGPVRWLGEALDLHRISTLEPLPPAALSALPQHLRKAEYGFGFTGTLIKPVAYADFCRILAGVLGRPEWQGCGRRPEAVFRVACCPGSGRSVLAAVVAAGADIFITGDVKYHTALEALDAGVRILDVGHFILEEEMVRRFAKFLDLELDITVTYIPSRDPLAVEHVPMA